MFILPLAITNQIFEDSLNYPLSPHRALLHLGISQLKLFYKINLLLL
jgi:hypothetical protein